VTSELDRARDLLSRTPILDGHNDLQVDHVPESLLSIRNSSAPPGDGHCSQAHGPAHRPGGGTAAGGGYRPGADAPEPAGGRVAGPAKAPGQ
jgi:hypothetical protein